MGLAAASALVVLIASGVVVSRLTSGDGPRRHSEAAPAPGLSHPGSSSPGAGSAEGAPSTSVPVPPPAPAGMATAGSGPATFPENLRTAAGGGSSPAGEAFAPDGNPAGPGPTEGDTAGGPMDGEPGDPMDGDAGNAPEGGATEGGATEGGATEGGATGGSPGGDGSPEGSRPDPQEDPESAGLLAASVSVGEGAGGAVAGIGLGDRPEIDVTVGTTPLVGDAPPSSGTGVELGGRLLQPPPTLPAPPG